MGLIWSGYSVPAVPEDTSAHEQESGIISSAIIEHDLSYIQETLKDTFLSDSQDVVEDVNVAYASEPQIPSEVSFFPDFRCLTFPFSSPHDFERLVSYHVQEMEKQTSNVLEHCDLGLFLQNLSNSRLQQEIVSIVENTVQSNLHGIFSCLLLPSSLTVAVEPTMCLCGGKVCICDLQTDECIEMCLEYKSNMQRLQCLVQPSVLLNHKNIHIPREVASLVDLLIVIMTLYYDTEKTHTVQVDFYDEVLQQHTAKYDPLQIYVHSYFHILQEYKNTRPNNMQPIGQPIYIARNHYHKSLNVSQYQVAISETTDIADGIGFEESVWVDLIEYFLPFYPDGQQYTWNANHIAMAVKKAIVSEELWILFSLRATVWGSRKNDILRNNREHAHNTQSTQNTHNNTNTISNIQEYTLVRQSYQTMVLTPKLYKPSTFKDIMEQKDLIQALLQSSGSLQDMYSQYVPKELPELLFWTEVCSLLAEIVYLEITDEEHLQEQ